MPETKPEKKSTVGMILVIFVLAGAAGAAYYYIKCVKGRKPKDEDMDFFDDEGYEEEPYINEDEDVYKRQHQGQQRTGQEEVHHLRH